MLKDVRKLNPAQIFCKCGEFLTAETDSVNNF